MSDPRPLLVTKGLDIGGTERVVVDLARGLARQGVPVEVAVVNDDRDGLRSLLDGAGVPVHGLGGSDRIGPAALERLVRLVRQSRFDVVHVHGPLPAVAVRAARRPVVTTAHTMWGALRPSTRLAWRLTAARDAATVAVSAAVAASLPAASRALVRIIPHGVDPVAVAAVRPARAPALDAVPVFVVTVASHRAVKNYPGLLKALRVAIDLGAAVHLRAIGDGPDLGRHRALAHSLGLDSSVTFELPTPDALAVIASADLLVVASDVEGQPLVVSEALALGVPVIATAVGRVPDLVDASVGRVVATGDPGALGRAIAELATDGELRARLATSARPAGLAWTLDDVVASHRSLYEEVAGG